MWKVFRGYRGKFFVGLEGSTEVRGPFDTLAVANAVAFKLNHPVT